MATFHFPQDKSIQDMELETLKLWKDKQVFQKSIDQRPKDNLYVFYDGPPFISGLPHYGHLLGSIAKDVIPRYWTMKGKRVERVWGWDAHGLTVENKVQKRLKIEKRRDIEKYGVEEFVKECYKYTSEVSEEWKWYIDRIARWVDMDHAYKTIDQPYMESVMWAFKNLYDKGLIYEGVYTSLFCPTCGTPVSNFEIGMDNSYMESEDPAVTIKFPITTPGELEGANILAWTTTPWTLPSNRALVVDDKSPYVLVDFESEKYIVAKARLETVFLNKNYVVIEEFSGKKLIGLNYEPLYKIFKYSDKEFKVYSYPGMVNMEDGTGIVHSAPGFGDIDTDMGKHYGIRVMLVLDDEGKFIQGDSSENPFVGIFYKDSNPIVMKDLNSRNLVFDESRIVHRVPFHDRCDTLLIYRAQNSWFVDVKKLKPDMLKYNENINWVPDHLKYGRFKLNIEQAPDWCISRNRFWATPMPVWKSDDGETIVVGSVKELEELSGKKIADLHRPFIDAVTFEINGKIFKRIPEVLDSWFEAGSMPYAQIHYPFENQQKFEENFPGDYIIEYISQVRAWFHVMHVLSTALFDTNSFKNVITTGVMAGTDGRKMSKTFNNYTDPKEVLQKVGGDGLRLYLMNSPLMVGENANFNDEDMRTKVRNVLNPLWNSAKFFSLYANEFKFEPKKKYGDSKNVLDRWVTARLHETIKNISRNIESYLVPPAVQEIENFVDDLSRWYVRRSRDRISNGEEETLNTFYRVLIDFSKALAPVTPFISEAIYQVLKLDSDPESVHLCEFPKHDEGLISESRDLLDQMKSDREIVSLALSIRVTNSIPVRQPLQTLISTKKPNFEEVIKDEVNVKEIEFEQDLTKYQIDKTFALDSEGKVSLKIELNEDLRFEGLEREFIRKIQGLRKENNLTVSDTIKVFYKQDPELNKVIEKFGKDIMSKVGASELNPGEEYKVVKM